MATRGPGELYAVILMVRTLLLVPFYLSPFLAPHTRIELVLLLRQSNVLGQYTNAVFGRVGGNRTH